MAKSKISAAASKRKLNPRSVIRSDYKLESINEQFKFDSIDITNKTSDMNSYKSNNSLNQLIEKAKQNLRSIKLSDSSESSLPIKLKASSEKLNTIENFVKISNDFNLDQEKTLSSESNRMIKKSTSCNSSSELMDTNTFDSNHIHIYDNSIACHHHHHHHHNSSNYDNTSTLSDISTATTADSPLLMNRSSKKIKILNKIPSNKSIDNQELNELNKNGVVEYLKSKFNNESKSFEGGLDKIQSPDEVITTKYNEQINNNNNHHKKTLTYSRSLKLDQTNDINQINNRNELLLLTKPGTRVAMLINDLKSSTEPLAKRQTSPDDLFTSRLDSPPTVCVFFCLIIS